MAKTQQHQTLTAVLAGKWEQSVRKMAELAEALPEDKLESALVDGIRTPGAVLRHVAFWNQYVADSLHGRATDDTANELPLAAYGKRSAMLEALQRSSGDVSTALLQRAEPDAKTVEMVVSFLEHTAEHYGQLVVYARLRGVVPPASRG